jgi:hypothetical protein
MDGVYVPLNNPVSVAFDKQYSLYAIDNAADGSTPIWQFSSDGSTATLFNTNTNAPTSSLSGNTLYFRNLVFDQAGNAFVACDNNIVKISAGTINVIAGDSDYQAGYADGQGKAAKFSNIGGLAIDPSGNLLAVDINNKCIRKIAPDGTVTTPYSGSFFKGNFPYVGIAVDKAGNIFYTVNSPDYAIVEITTSGVQQVVGWWSASNYGAAGNPTALGVDANGNIYFVGSAPGNAKLYQLVNGVPVPLPAPTDYPVYNYYQISELALDAAGNIYAAGAGIQVIRKVLLH